MLGAWQRGSTGLCCPTQLPCGHWWDSGTLASCVTILAPTVYSHVHNDDHVLWGGGTLDVPVGYRVGGQAGWTHFGGNPDSAGCSPRVKPCQGTGTGELHWEPQAPRAAVTPW